MKKYLKNFSKYKNLVTELVKKDIKLKYRRSYLGILWTLLEPLLSMAVLAVVFSNLKGKEDVSFPVYILSGRLVVTYFSNATKQAAKSIRSNASMIKKVYVPKYIYPLASSISNYIIFLISLIVLAAVSIVFKVKPTWHIFEAILPMFFLFVMATGVGLIVSTMTVFFRDVEYLWGVAMMLVHYCSAIFYTPEAVVANGYGWVFDVNPVYAAVRNFRNAVLYGTSLHGPSMLYLAVFSTASLIIGAFVFYKKQDKFILHI